MTETQATITAWATETFGPDGSDFRIAARANDELAELLRAIAGGGADPAAICAEAADVVIVLARLAERHGIAAMRHHRLWGDSEPAGAVQPLAIDAAMRMANLLQMTGQTRRPVNATAMRFLTLGIVANMWAVCCRLGHDLQTEVDAKMVINRARTWRRDGAGCGYHVHVPAVETMDARAYRESVEAAAREAKSSGLFCGPLGSGETYVAAMDGEVTADDVSAMIDRELAKSSAWDVVA